MKAFFKELFEYNHYSNLQLANLFLELSDNASEKAVKLFNHIINAQQIWNNRIKPWEQPFTSWEIHPPEVLSKLDRSNYEAAIRIIDEIPLNTLIAYVNTKGDRYNNTVRDILFHVINHSTYHRGQIATCFREYGIEPLVTDYIAHKRV